MLRELKVSSENIYESLNKNKKNKIFKKNYVFRRSIFAKKNIEKNEVISLKNIMSLRPLVGIKSEKIFDIIGKKAKNKIIKDKPIFFSDLSS